MAMIATHLSAATASLVWLVIEKVRAFCRTFPQTLDDMERLLNRNRIFVERTKDVGLLTKEEATNRSATGPIARASGVPRDMRLIDGLGPANTLDLVPFGPGLLIFGRDALVILSKD